MIKTKFLTTEEEYAYITDLQIDLPDSLIEPLQKAAFNVGIIDYYYYLKAKPISEQHSRIILMSQELPGLSKIENYYWFVKGFLACHFSTC